MRKPRTRLGGGSSVRPTAAAEGAAGSDGVTSPEHEGMGFAMPEPCGDERRTSATGFLLDALRHRRAGRFLLNGLISVLFVSGIGMFSYPLFTDVYTEEVVQRRLEEEFARVQIETFDEWEETVVGTTGVALTKLVMPKIGIETLVVEGTSPEALRAGAGHYPNTPLPGQPGNVAIAGHRTTYGKPFNRVDELARGDEIWLVTPVGDYRYVIGGPPDGWDANPYVTDPKDWSVVGPTGEPSVTLTTCEPKGSARLRMVVRATLEESHPAGYWQSEVADAA